MSRNRWPIVVTLLVVLSLLGGQVLSAPPRPAAPRVLGLAQGTDFLISHVEGSHRASPAVAHNDDLQQYLVVWTDGREDSTYRDIYGQIFSYTGRPQGGNFVVHDEPAGTLGYPDVTYDTVNQRYLVVWYNLTEVDVEGVVLNSDGSPYTAAFDVAMGIPAEMRGFPAAAFHASNQEYLVAYQGGSPSNMDIYARRVGPTGIVSIVEYVVTAVSANQTDPDVSVDTAADGDFLIVWQDGRTGTDQIYGRIINHAWQMGFDFLISSEPGVPCHNPAVAFNPAAGTDGGWLVVFQWDDEGDGQIGGQRLTAAGAPVGYTVDICVAAGFQGYADVAYVASQEIWMVVWEDHRASTTGYDIWGRYVDPSGGIGADCLPIAALPDQQTVPAVVAASTSAGCLVVFADSRTDDITGQRTNSTGVPGPPLLAVSTPLGDQRQPSPAYNSQDGEYLVVWHDERAQNWDIWGQRVDVDGTILGASFVICSDPHDQQNPTVTYCPDTNRYLVAWDDYRSAEGDIYGQVVDADGSLNGDNVVIAAVGTTGRHAPRLAYNPISGEFFVVYTYAAENGNIRGRRLGVDGVPLAAEIDIAVGGTDQGYPDVACRTLEAGGGDYLVAWRDEDGTQRDIRGQRLSQSGSLLGGLDLCTNAASQWTPAVAYSPVDDRYLVVWSDDRDSAAQGRDIYGRQVSGAGVRGDEFAVSTAAENQYAPAITYSRGPGLFIVAWSDARNEWTAPDIFGQRVSGTGELVGAVSYENEWLYVDSGGQESVALAWAGDENQGLLAWDDQRSGDNYDIYGMLLSDVARSHRAFLPLVIKVVAP